MSRMLTIERMHNYYMGLKLWPESSNMTWKILLNYKQIASGSQNAMF